MIERDGGPAFPRPIEGQIGMSLRDWFAGQALAAFLSAPDSHGDDVGHDARMDSEKAADWAYDQADAMLRARDA